MAAGRGERFGTAKQYEILGDARVLDWSLRAASNACEGVVLVVGADRVDDPEPGAAVVVAGGATRSDSVRAGLRGLPEGVEIVVVHDAARPMADATLFTAVIDAVAAGADGAVCAIPVADTLKRVREAAVVSTVDRADLVAVQTPQAFNVGVLRRAHAAGGDATDDAALVEAIGGRVAVVPGHPRNRKLTTPEDLAIARALLGHQ